MSRMQGWGRAAAALAALAAGLLAAGCGVGRVPPAPAMMDLGADTAPAPALPARAPIALAPVSGAPQLADAHLLWRVGDAGAPRAYATYRWVAPPAGLVGQRLAERLSRQGPVLAQNVGGALPQLTVTLSRFEQVYAADGSASVGVIALQAVLVRSREVLGQVHIARSSPAGSQDAPGGVQALRRATDAAADQLAVWLSTQVGSRPAAPAEAPAALPRRPAPGPDPLPAR